MESDHNEAERKLVELGNHLRIGAAKRLKRQRDDKIWNAIEGVVEDQFAKEAEAREKKLREEGEIKPSQNWSETEEE